MKKIFLFTFLAVSFGLADGAFATTLTLHCEGFYATASFTKNLKLSNEGPEFSSSRQGSTAGLGKEDHYCGSSTLYIYLTDNNQLELKVVSNQGCSYTDNFDRVIKNFTSSEEINLDGNYGDNRFNVKCTPVDMK
jgi:hypothetical protein